MTSAPSTPSIASRTTSRQIDEQRLEHEVDAARDRPRPEPGERQLERHAFRRRDGDAILVLHGMKVERFISEREGDWRELDGLLRARRRGAPRRAASVLRLAALYRGAAADLALARRGHPGDPIVTRLESLVARARQAVYAEEPRRGSLRTFFARTYWVRVRERPAPLLLAIALLLVPALLAAAWALADPGAARRARPRPVPRRRRAGRRHRHDGRRVRRVLERRHDEQHPGDVPRVRRRDPVRPRDGARRRLQRR